MRSTFSYVGLFSLSMLAMATSLAAGASPANTGSSRMIVGSANAMHFKAQADGEFYLQAATFKSASNAETYQHHLSNKIQYPVTIQPRGKYHVVIVGPVHTAAEVRELGDVMSGVSFVKNRTAIPVSTSLGKIAPIHVSVGAMDKDAALMSKRVANHFEVIGALGVGAFDPGDGVLGVTSSETDRLVQSGNNNWNNLAAQLGVGYVHYFRDPQQYPDLVLWFPSIEPEVNAYYLGDSTIKGDVWRFESANFNELTYKMPIKSMRVMFDGALTIVTVKQWLSFYAIGGLGNAWNQASYRDTANGGSSCTLQSLNLNTATHSNFAWEAGAGLIYAFNHRMGLSLEYLYADLGTMKTSAIGNTGTITTPVIVPASFHLNSQAVLFGLHVSL